MGKAKKIEWSSWKESKTQPGTFLRMGRTGPGRDALIFGQYRKGKQGKPKFM